MKKIAIKSNYTILLKFAETEEDMTFEVGEKIIVEDYNGRHLVEVVINEVDQNKNCDFKIIRKADENDLKAVKQNEEKCEKAQMLCNQYVNELNLDMRLKKVYSNLDASKIIFYFTSSGRVDFRELVKRLAGDYARTRIEMRQINEREEVAMLGGLGACGRVCCCASHLENFGDVSIKMAKNQNIALNPSKVNGYCGKLLCCLGYENEDYIEALKVMPKVGQVLSLPDGEKGVVYFNHLISKIVRVEVEIDDAKILKDYSLQELAECNDFLPKNYEICDCENCQCPKNDKRDA